MKGDSCEYTKEDELRLCSIGRQANDNDDDEERETERWRDSPCVWLYGAVLVFALGSRANTARNKHGMTD